MQKWLTFRANDGCLYVYDREQNQRTLKVSKQTTKSLVYYAISEHCHAIC